MLQGDFYTRLILLIVVGIIYVRAYMNMAKRNSKETEPERHTALKILGGFWAIMGLLMGALGVYAITQITFPTETIGPYFSDNMIYRTSDQTLYWGYPTMAQSQCINWIAGAFGDFALAAYCFLFRSSHSKWYIKVGKVAFCILFFMFYISATNFHYFDIYEWIAPVLFTVMAVLALRNKKEQKTYDIPNTDSHENLSATVSEVNKDDSSYMPPMTNEIESVQDTTTRNDKNEPEVLQAEQCDIKPNSSEEGSTPETTDNELVMTSDSLSEQDIASPIPTPTIKFCRHCGGKLDYISDKYCKHCGKPLR